MVNKTTTTTNNNQPVYFTPIKINNEVWNKTNKVFLKFRDELWSYIKNSYQVVRRVCKIVAVKIPRFDPKMLKVISALGLAHAINAILILSKYPSDIMGFLENLTLKDIEGIILSGVSLLINPLDALDSTITFASSAASLSIVPVVSIFSLIALPIAITLVGYGTLKGIYDLIRLGIHKHQLTKKIEINENTEKNIEKLREKLEKQLTITEAEETKIRAKYSGDDEKIDRKIDAIKTRKINTLKRHTDEKIVNLMTNLLNEVKKDPTKVGVVDKDLVNDMLSDTHTLMNRKIVVGVTGTALNAAMLASLIATAICPISALVIPIVALVRHTVAISKQVYMKKFYTEGLHHKDMTKKIVLTPT